MKKILLITFAVLLALFIALYFNAKHVIGTFLDPVLEAKLSDLFGMPVTIGKLSVDPITGLVKARDVTFKNQPNFSDKHPHLDVKKLEFNIDFRKLKEKDVRIHKVILTDALYFIDRVAGKDEEATNNVTTWYDHMKRDIRKSRKKRPPLAEGELPPKRWSVSIQSIEIRNGTFIFEDSSGGGIPKKLVFQKFDGVLKDFKWPTADPSFLEQEVKIRGMYGQKKLAPFWIEGWANFSSGQVSFDLEGQIKGADALEAHGFWEGLPIVILKGEFDLSSHTMCLRRELTSTNTLTLKSLRVKPGPSASNKIWGVSLTTWMLFVQDQKEITLEIPVRGNITDPKFHFLSAFSNAFQKSLQQKSVSGVKFFAKSATSLAGQTPGIVKETPSLLTGGFGKITTIITPGNKGDESSDLAKELENEL